MAIPIAVPTMPDSANGVSTTRWSPYFSARPSVIRKTPPRVPTSSPRMIIEGSAARLSDSARFKAAAMVTAGGAWVVAAADPAAPFRPGCRGAGGWVMDISACDTAGSSRSVMVHSRKFLAQQCFLVEKTHCRFGIDPPEQITRIGFRAGQQPFPEGRCVGLAGCLGLIEPGAVEQAAVCQIAPQSVDRVFRRPLIHLVGGSIAGGIVGVGVRIHPVGDGLDESWPGSVPGMCDRGADGREDRR